MKLVRFGVNNFRAINGGLEKNSINFDSSNAIFIFGQNNVGKSSFLRAYEAFYEDAVNESDFTDSQNEDIVAELWIEIDEAKDKEVIDEGTGDKFSNLKEKYLSADAILKLKKIWKFENKGNTSANETFNVQTEEWEEIGYGGIGMHGVFKPLMMKPLFIQAMPTESQVESIVNDILKESAAKKLSVQEDEDLREAAEMISKLQDKVYNKAAIRAYKEKVNSKFTALFGDYEVGIDDGTSKLKYTHDKLGKDFKITFNKIGSDQTSTYLQMGHGAVRMAIFLLMLMRDELREEGLAQKNFLVLFEEPELFLHPMLTKKLRNLIYEVSADNMPFQILSASHSPQMIDITKDHTSLVRMVKNEDLTTSLFQVDKNDLKNSQQTTDEEVKKKIYEILRFDPFVCESFYADEVVLVEGDTEAIVWRGYQQCYEGNKEIFVVNCHSCLNIPFYQKVFSKFNIPYSVICDTDHKNTDENVTGWDMKKENPNFTSHIQKAIADQFYSDKSGGKANKFFVNENNFEDCHKSIPEPFKYDDSGDDGKPFNANRYWNKLYLNKNSAGFNNVPIINYMRNILGIGT
jgi:putative ATP-dependent endonuclease of the OLD family